MPSYYNCRCWLQRPSRSAPTPDAPLTISVAHQEWNHTVIALVAMARGYFEEAGLARVTLTAFPDDEQAQLEALAAGVVQIAMDPATHRVLAAQSQGADIYIIAPRRKSHAFAIIAQPDIQSFADLRGKTLEMIVDAEPTQQIRQLLKMAGLEWDEDVKIHWVDDVSMHDILGMNERFERGELPIITAHPWEIDQWTARGYSLLADSSKIFPPRQDRVVVATGPLVQARPHSVTAFLKGYIQASRFILEPSHEEEIRTILEQAGFLAAEEERANWSLVFGYVQRRISPDAALPLDGLEQVLAEQREAGNVSTDLAIDRLVRLDPLHEAQRALGLAPASS
jgi:ABC-type nitrate/sulfonate/bicarbonate transport system substrate-binding protein